jgi:hypothetical protein
MRSIVIAIALTTVSISFAAVLHDLRRLPARAALLDGVAR